MPLIKLVATGLAGLLLAFVFQSYLSAELSMLLLGASWC